MSRYDVVTEIRKALGGTKRIQITFRKDGRNCLPFFQGLMNSGVVALDPGEDRIFHTETWEAPDSRKCKMTLTQKFDMDWFVNQLYRYIEAIIVI